MARKTMRRIQGDFVTEQVQRNVEEFVKSNIPDWVADGVMITDVAINGVNAISHGLQRQPLGWIITDKTSNANIWRVSWSATTLTLQSSANTTVNIWVY